MDKLDMEHLGDGVYVGHDGYQLWLTVNDHRNPELIAIEPRVLGALLRYAEDKLGIEIKS